MQKAQILEILLLAVTFACQSRNSSHALRVEKVWHFVSVPKRHSSQYFTQAKVNEKEMLECFSQSNIQTLFLSWKSEGLNCKLTFHKIKLLTTHFFGACNK